MAIFYRVVVDVPADVTWQPGMELPVKATACLLVDAVETEPRCEAWMNVDGVRAGDDMVPDVTPLVGELLARMIG